MVREWNGEWMTTPHPQPWRVVALGSLSSARENLVLLLGNGYRRVIQAGREPGMH